MIFINDLKCDSSLTVIKVSSLASSYIYKNTEA